MFVIFLLHRGYASVAIAACFFAAIIISFVIHCWKREYRVCVRHIIGEWGGGGVGEVYYSLCPRGEENSWMPRSTPRGWPGLQMTALVQWSVFQVMQKWQTKFKSVFQSDEKTRNEIQIRFQSNAKTKNEKRNSYPFFKVMRKLNEKRKLKFIVVFQSWAKTKNKKQNSNLFFDVMRKRKMEISLEFPFPMPSKNGWH